MIANNLATQPVKQTIMEKEKPVTDIHIVSYPKSGRTWLRSILGKYLAIRYEIPESLMLETEKATSQAGLPRTAFTHDGSAMREKKHYTTLGFDRSKYANSKVLLLGRDLKDTLVSAYFQSTKRVKVFDGSISDFLQSDRYGVRKILAFYIAWEHSKKIPTAFEFIRYEAMHSNPQESVSKVLTFLGETSIDQQALQQAIEFCSFDNMQNMEKNNEFKSNILQARDSADPESFKVRKGKVGGYTDYLSDADIKYIDELVMRCEFDFAKFG